MNERPMMQSKMHSARPFTREQVLKVYLGLFGQGEGVVPLAHKGELFFEVESVQKALGQKIPERVEITHLNGLSYLDEGNMADTLCMVGSPKHEMIERIHRGNPVCRVIEYPSDSNIASWFIIRDLVISLLKDADVKWAEAEDDEDNEDEFPLEFWVCEDLCTVLSFIDKQVFYYIKQENLKITEQIQN